MALPFNPMSFVTPYTAVGAGHRGGGASFANSINQAKQQKVSEGYLANTQHQTEQNDKRFGQKEVDQARERLDGALMSGNQDAVELAANNLRAVATRYGYSLTETRSDAQLKSGVTTPVGKQEAFGDGSDEHPFDVDAYDAAQAKGEVTNGSSDKVNAEADARINSELAQQPNPFTGGVPGGSLPANDPEGRPIDRESPGYKAIMAAAKRQEAEAPPGFYDTIEAKRGGDLMRSGGTAPAQAPGVPATMPPVRTPGGSLPAASAAEPPGTSEAPIRGYSLNGPDGKPIYSVAPNDIAGRQRQRVGAVFEGLASKTQDPNELKWLAQAQAEAEKLVGIMSLDEAVKTGLAHYVGQMNSRDKLAMVEANHKPRFGGGGGAPAMASGVVGGKEGQVLGQLSDDELQLIQHFKANSRFPAMEEADRGARAALNSLNSSNPSSQFFAIRQLIQSMSGKTVGAKEEGFYSRMSGLADEIANKFNMAAGEEMTPEYRDKVKILLQEMASYYANERADLGKQAASYYEGRMQDRADGEYVARHKPYVEGAFTGIYPSSPSSRSAPGKAAPPKAKKSVKDLE